MLVNWEWTAARYYCLSTKRGRALTIHARFTNAPANPVASRKSKSSEENATPHAVLISFTKRCPTSVAVNVLRHFAQATVTSLKLATFGRAPTIARFTNASTLAEICLWRHTRRIVQRWKIAPKRTSRLEIAVLTATIEIRVSWWNCDGAEIILTQLSRATSALQRNWIYESRNLSISSVPSRVRQRSAAHLLLRVRCWGVRDDEQGLLQLPFKRERLLSAALRIRRWDEEKHNGRQSNDARAEYWGLF